MSVHDTVRPPYIGAAYYPEDWPLKQIDEDIALMKEAGMNVMRIGEFAWSRMEPEEGEFEFDWLHLVVDKLGTAGIATIMGTPTATPPVWLTEKYPEVLFVDHNGRPLGHGGRRHTCPNSPVYRDHCARIVTKMAEEFRKDGNIIGWQIDNEVYPYGGSRSCCCPVCVEKFHEYLAEQYGTVDDLNEAWCTNLWSQTYNSFSQVPIPRPDVWHHPSLLAAWEEFSSRSYVDFVEHQAKILHKLTKHPIGTDMMMMHGVDHYAMNRKLDVVQFNHYHYREDVWQAGFWFDYVRPIKDVPFWNTETSTCWSGSVRTSGYSEPGFCRANSWLPIAMGGEANLYWLWRRHWAGQELMHGSVIQSCGRPMHIFDEVKEVSKGYADASDFINGTKPERSGLAVHFSNSAYITFKCQPMVNDFDYQAQFLNSVYRPLVQAQFRPDVISPEVDLDAYSIILTPFLPSLDEAGLRERLKSWIENGGVWIAGPMSDIRTLDGTHFKDAPYGSLEEWGGVYCKYQIPGEPHDFAIRWKDEIESKGAIWYDALEPRDAEALAEYIEGPMAGLAAVTVRKMGGGYVIVLGTMIPPAELIALLKPYTEVKDIRPAADATDNLVVVPRKGKGGEGMIAVEVENRPASLFVPQDATDILTGEKHFGAVDIPPYGVMVLKYV